MIRSLEKIKNRIRSISNTQKVTHAMELISAAKLNRFDKVLYAARPYCLKLESILSNFLSGDEARSSPFLQKSSLQGKIGLCLITSDSGLCGGYNNNIIRLAQEFIDERGKDKIALIAVGKRGLNYFKKVGVPILNSFIELSGRYSDKLCEQIANYLNCIFICGQVDEVYVAYTHYKTVLIHRPRIIKFLNLEVPLGKKKIEYILEPNKKRILEELIPKYILVKTGLFLLDSFTSEHAARIVAMKEATDNAEELLDKLSVLRNKVRQANITQEIMGIIVSSEALKG